MPRLPYPLTRRAQMFHPAIRERVAAATFAETTAGQPVSKRIVLC